jgi:4-amino-4-deoxy-L-arabinose transferase-like glycosyltransferase
VLWLVLGGAAIRLLLSPLIGLSVDESYAVVMARRLALSYFDHPPLLFWIPGLVERLTGSEWGPLVRLPFVLLFAGTTWLVYRIGAVLFSEEAGLWAAVVLNLILFFTLNAGSWILPDGPLLFFEACAVVALLPALFGEGGTGSFVLFGLFAGLALLSKYHAVFLLGGVGLFLLSSRPHRRLLLRSGPTAALVTALLCFLPVLVWNALHGWASFRFQGGRAAPLEPENDTPFWGSVAGQAAWMLPWIFVPLLGVLLSALRGGPEKTRRWLLACLGAPPIVFFTAVTLFGRRGLPHWQAPGYFMLTPLLGEAVAARIARRDPWVRRWLWGSALGLTLVLALVASQVQTGWITRAAPALLVRGDPTIDLLYWRPVAQQIHRWGYPRKGVVVAGATWADAAKVGYALGPRVKVTSVGGDPRGFEFVTSQESLVGRDVLLVASRRAGYMEPMIAYAPYFSHITALGTVPILRSGTEEIAVSVYLCERLLLPPPPTTRVR